MSARAEAAPDFERVAADVGAAAERIGRHTRRTPLERSPALETNENRVFLKLENTQLTGSFKLRGAFNKVLTTSEAARARGVVAASTGNHGMAVALAAASVGCPAIVFAPENAASSKIASIREHGAEVRLVGNDGIVAERAARAFAVAEDRPYVSPYNDLAVIAGQGTLAVEILEQLSPARLDRIYIALGGGGLLAGVGSYLRAHAPSAEIVACSPARSAVMHHSIAAGRILDLESQPTLSDGTAGGVEEDTVTFELCRHLISRSLLVSEGQIRQAIRLVVGRHHTLIEGAAGVAVAGYLADPHKSPGEQVAIVLCGANIDSAKLKEVLLAP